MIQRLLDSITTFEWSILKEWVLPAVILLAAYLFGLALTMVCRSRICRIPERVSISFDETTLHRLTSRIPLWTSIIGLLFVIPLLPLKTALSNTLHDIIYTVLILSITWSTSSIAGDLVRLSPFSKHVDTSSIAKVVAQILIWIIGTTITLRQLGISITPLLTALGVGGLAVALALQDTLSNLFAGIQIIMSGQVRIGDYVRLETGDEGYVIDINWRTTTLEALYKNVIVVPNAKLATSIATNYQIPQPSIIVRVNAGVSYNSDLEHVERVCLETAVEVMKRHPGAVADAEPSFRLSEFGDSSVNFRVLLHAREYADQFALSHVFLMALFKRFREEGIEIPFPQRVVTMKQDKPN